MMATAVLDGFGIAHACPRRLPWRCHGGEQLLLYETLCVERKVSLPGVLLGSSYALLQLAQADGEPCHFAGEST